MIGSRRDRARQAIGCAFVLAVFSLPAGAAGDWVRAGAVEGRLVSATQGVGNQTRLQLGLHLRLDEGWKTYWRFPGDSGLPPAFDWTGTHNLARPVPRFPAPQRFDVAGLQTFGYKHELVLPMTAAVIDPARPVQAAARVDLLVCSATCIPETLRLALTLPAGPAVASAEAALLQRFAEQVPDDGTRHGLHVQGIEVDAQGDTPSLVLRATASQPFDQPDAIIEGLPADVALGPPAAEMRRAGSELRLRFPVVQYDGALEALVGRAVTATLIDGDRSAEAVQAIKAAPGPIRLLPLVLTALLGGLILNLMPCVLPVISLKLLALAEARALPRSRMRASLLASAAGVVFSFLLLAAMIIGLKAAGASVGWGMQFQQPLFLVVMVLLVALFAANLWGHFDVPLPRWAADAAGAGPHAQGSLAGHFASGAFATLLATPCSAPFLGTAIGFALAGRPIDIGLVFAALGVGMALPYAAVAAVPRLAERLPRPGAWMLTLRRLLGFALAASAAWLLGVLQAQIGTPAAGAIGVLVLLVWTLLAWRHRAGRRFLLLPVGGLIAAAILVPMLMPASPRPLRPEADPHWQPFDERRVAQEVDAGRTVFVHITAGWCVTCQVNKRLVLDRGEVARRLFGDPSIVALQADWTRPDPRIAAYLAGFGRYGIPFDAVFGPAAPQGIVLGEVLTGRAVLDALSAASARLTYHRPS